MPVEIIIPRLGWSMEEGNFIGWLKKDGEPIRIGEPLFTLENEKAAQDIEATDSGILRISKEGPQAGSVVQVGQLIGYLISENETLERGVTPPKESSTPKEYDPLPEVDSVVPITDSLPPKSQPPEKTRAPASSPRARRRAAELGVDATRLQGSGRTGRIIEADVLKAVKLSRPPVLSSMRRAIAQRTAASFASAPHFYLRCEVDATALIKLREELLPEIQRASGVRLTLTDLLLRAQALALRDFPVANSIWQDDKIIALPTCDIGLVVGLRDGLIIPIVRGAEASDLATLAKQRASLVEAARSAILPREALQGGATSLSNLGNTRVDEFTAVLPSPHSSILAVGRAVPRPFSVEGLIGVRTTLKLCLSVDHRVLDGGPAAGFLGRIVELLEAPDALVAEKASI